MQKKQNLPKYKPLPVPKLGRLPKQHPIPMRSYAFNDMPTMTYGKKYVSYRKGLLLNIFQLISQYGNFGDKDLFVKDCLNDPDINELLNNQVTDKLDEMNGPLKLLLTIYSKFISHKYII